MSKQMKIILETWKKNTLLENRIQTSKEIIDSAEAEVKKDAEDLQEKFKKLQKLKKISKEYTLIKPTREQMEKYKSLLSLYNEQMKQAKENKKKAQMEFRNFKKELSNIYRNEVKPALKSKDQNAYKAALDKYDSLNKNDETYEKFNNSLKDLENKYVEYYIKSFDEGRREFVFPIDGLIEVYETKVKSAQDLLKMSMEFLKKQKDLLELK